MTESPRGSFQIQVIPEDPKVVLKSVREGLTGSPRSISPRFFYDDHGSKLFERITELPEYYPTRTEESILKAVADDMVRVSGAEELIELGSGAATKTRILLDAMREQGKLRRYLPFDVSEGMVRRVADELLAEYAEIEIDAVVGDFTSGLHSIPGGMNRLLVFLGGTIGNFRRHEAVTFLKNLRQALDGGDYFLLGADLIKDVNRLEAAYNDRQGVTALFNKNALCVLNRLLEGDFDPEGFEHHAFYNAKDQRIEMWLRSMRSQEIHLPKIELEFLLSDGEAILTEVSRKFDRKTVESMLTQSGFELVEFYTDPENLFALALARRS